MTKEEHKFPSCCQVETWLDFVMGEIKAKSPPFFCLPSLFIFRFGKTNNGKWGLTIPAVSTPPAILQAFLAGPLLSNFGEISVKTKTKSKNKKTPT